MTKELNRIKRARSFQDEDSTSPASPLTDPPRTNSLPLNGGGLAQLDTGNPFGLDEVDNLASQVSFQSLVGYHLNSLQITELFREYEPSLQFCSVNFVDSNQFCQVLHAPSPNPRHQDENQQPTSDQPTTILDHYTDHLASS